MIKTEKKVSRRKLRRKRDMINDDNIAEVKRTFKVDGKHKNEDWNAFAEEWQYWM